jgi:hypothetical protein
LLLKAYVSQGVGEKEGIKEDRLRPLAVLTNVDRSELLPAPLLREETTEGEIGRI